ncbi:avidin-related protein 1-like isoform X2 [Hyla sarda]|uniref:avidin-related protein 1-like isoform X2 n=1 Tax=Hyla sarda TaxID=327740 RepID=UPI0024C23895|nr:avidin-related protein 1-like isoform X2 [Hyla sarda]
MREYTLWKDQGINHPFRHNPLVQQAAHCNVTGVWVNTLGSVLKLFAEGSQLKGSLHSSVALYPGAAGERMTGKLIGLIGQGDQPTFTMSVSWKEGSITAWVGQCFQTSDCPVLKTIWLLRSKATLEDNWKATRIGEDVFYPQKKCAIDGVV